MAKRNNRQNPMYDVWAAMKQRCDNPNSISYKYYGGRGIKYSDEWRYFENFKVDMEKTYKKGLTLDRTDNDGNYCKDNCRWVSQKIQQNNRRNSRLFNFNHKKMTILQWGNYLGINRSTLAQRFYVYHWPMEKVFTKKEVDSIG